MKSEVEVGTSIELPSGGSHVFSALALVTSRMGPLFFGNESVGDVLSEMMASADPTVRLYGRRMTNALMRGVNKEEEAPKDESNARADNCPQKQQVRVL